MFGDLSCSPLCWVFQAFSQGLPVDTDTREREQEPKPFPNGGSRLRNRFPDSLLRERVATEELTLDAAAPQDNEKEQPGARYRAWAHLVIVCVWGSGSR